MSSEELVLKFEEMEKKIVGLEEKVNTLTENQKKWITMKDIVDSMKKAGMR